MKAYPFIAAIFDLDGTILESTGLFPDINRQLFGQFGMSVPEDFVRTIEGLSSEKTYEYLVDTYKWPVTAEALYDEFCAILEAQYRDTVILKPGAKQFIQYLSEKGLKLGVATAMNPRFIHMCLSRLGVYDYFDVIVTAEEAGDESKGTGRIYRETAERLGVSVTDCIVFEDTLTGVLGAKRAGARIYCVFDPASEPNLQALEAHADFHFYNFYELMPGKRNMMQTDFSRGFARESVKIIADMDFGFFNDDAMAFSLLLLAEQLNEAEILGVTLVGGNHFIRADYTRDDMLYRNSAGLLAEYMFFIETRDIPVAEGRDLPIEFDIGDIDDLAYSVGHFVDDGAHVPRLECGFDDGYGAVHFFDRVPADTLINSDDAARFLIEQVRANPYEVTILAIGPATNIARAVELDPEFASLAGRIIYMTGAFEEGGANITCFAEYNAFYDAAALQKCLTAGFREQIICPGSLTAPLDDDLIDRLSANIGDLLMTCSDDPVKFNILSKWTAFLRTNARDLPLWDPITVAVALRPEGITAQREAYVTIETDRASEAYAQTTAIPESIYRTLPRDMQARFGRATIVTAYDDFWRFVADHVTATSGF